MLTIAAIAGWIALPIAILRFQIRGLTPLLACNGAAGALMALHYGLSGLHAGAAMAATAAAAAWLQLVIGGRISLKGRFAIAIPAIAFCFYLAGTTASGWVGLLPVLAFTIGRIAETSRDDFWVRVISLCSTSAWLIYLAIEWSVPGLAFEIIGLSSNLLGLVRFHRSRVAALIRKRSTLDER